MGGVFPPRALGLVIEWAIQHKEELLDNWELVQKKLPLNKIEPLRYGEIMYHDIVAVICHDDFVLELHFDDGKSGMLDCKLFIAKGGIFSKLADPDVFAQVKIHPELGVLTWNDEIDIAPKTVYSLATNSPLPEWMTESEKVSI